MKNHLNLMPAEFQTRTHVKKAIFVWLAIWTLTAIGWFGICKYQKNYVASSQLLVDSLEQEFQPVKKMQREIAEMKTTLVGLETKVDTRIDTKEIHPMLSLMAAVGKSVAATGGQVYVENLVVNEQPRAIEGLPQVNSAYVLELSGLGTDSIAIAKFSTALRESGMFHSVDLKTNNEVTEPVSAWRYKLECSF